MTGKEIIEILDLQPHSKEGGYFKETYSSEETISPEALPDRYTNLKRFGTAIYYLLMPDTYSALHKLSTDEIFHYYLGDPVIMLQLYPDLTSKVITLGPEINKGQQVQVIVPKDTWQGSFLKDGGKYALLGTTMAPGFDFSDYKEGVRDSLVLQYPNQKRLIEKLAAQPDD